ncbi:hypothetical protein G7046_g1047 [Stylonectria norvegica]|nr:hypothetical protein G7046_g1047 [Stylonectria norvegica]
MIITPGLSALAMNLKKHRQRTAPFLQKSWLKGVDALQNSVMGVTLSAPKHHASFSDDDARPQKRRRLSSPDSLEELDQLVTSPRASDNRKTLRVEVLKVFHKESKKVRSTQCQSTVVPSEIHTTKANCRITISDLTSGWPRVLHCQSQACEIKTYKNPVGPHRVSRVDLPTPFLVPAESIMVNRHGEDGPDLSESYKLVVELEAGDDGPWPPLDTQDFSMTALGDPNTPAEPPKRNWIMSSKFKQVFGRIKSSLNVSPGYGPNQGYWLTDYVMDVDLRWTNGYNALKRLGKGLKPCITAIDPDGETFTNGHFEPLMDEELNGVNGHLHEEFPHEPGDEFGGGDRTPSRSLRTREKNTVYNLKQLSDQAQGKERKRRARAVQAKAAEGRVTYCLPINQPVCLDWFRCITCGAYHQSMLQLQVHLQTVHTNFEYKLETTSQGPQFRVSNRLESISTPPKTYQLGRPVKPFNLQTFAKGDQSWATSRLGPDNTKETVPSPEPKTILRRRGQRKREKIIVPETAQPLFDSTSKARLKPGEELPLPEPETAWLIHKYRGEIADFTDVTPAEKEYIREWDAFILGQSLTSSAYLPRAWLWFVEEHASWLVAAKHRMIEFGKHASVLLARDLLNDEAVDEAFRLINEARANPERTGEQANGTDSEEIRDEISTPKRSPRISQVRKGGNGCQVCQLPVIGPRLLVCAEKGEASTASQAGQITAPTQTALRKLNREATAVTRPQIWRKSAVNPIVAFSTMGPFDSQAPVQISTWGRKRKTTRKLLEAAMASEK